MNWGCILAGFVGYCAGAFIVVFVEAGAAVIKEANR